VHVGGGDGPLVDEHLRSHRGDVDGDVSDERAQLFDLALGRLLLVVGGRVFVLRERLLEGGDGLGWLPLLLVRERDVDEWTRLGLRVVGGLKLYDGPVEILVLEQLDPVGHVPLVGGGGCVRGGIVAGGRLARWVRRGDFLGVSAPLRHQRDEQDERTEVGEVAVHAPRAGA